MSHALDTSWGVGSVRGMEGGTCGWCGTKQERSVCLALSGKDQPDKPMVKPGGGQRKSDGVVVPFGVQGQHNPARGKGPDFDDAGGANTCKGMAGTARSNNPRRPQSAVDLNRLPPVQDDVRRLQRKLWAAAKQSDDRRFHALYDRIYRRDVLQRAWERVRANRGAAGIDKQTLADVEEYGVDRLIDEIAEVLGAGSYRPAPSRRVEIPKPAGGIRPLGIPTVKDRIVQAACKIVCEPIFEADFSPSSYGYRPGRSATDAAEAIRVAFARDHRVFAVEIDIRSFFDSIGHSVVMGLVERRVSDRRVLKLIRQWLVAGVLVDGVVQQTVAGTPQGGVISPLLANIVLNELDQAWDQAAHGLLVRYADDAVAMCHTRRQAEQALDAFQTLVGELGLELHPEKTRIVDLRDGKEGFDFLGWHFRARMSGRLWEQRRIRRYYLHRWPSQRSMKRVRDKVRHLTRRARCHADIREVIRDLNWVLRGWGNYFRTGNSAKKFNQLDSYIWWRLRRLLVKRYGRNLHAGRAGAWDRDFFEAHGLHRLRGTVQYPNQKAA